MLARQEDRVTLHRKRKNRAIEIHDSVLEALSHDNGDAILHFSQLYIHESEGRVGIDPGRGWSQQGRLTIIQATVSGSFPELPADVHDGHVVVDGIRYENIIPVSLEVGGEIELQQQSWNEVLRINRKGAKLERIGAAEYLEDFPGA